MFAVKAKIYGVPYNQSISIAFFMKHLVSAKEANLLVTTGSLVSIGKSASRNHEGSTFTEKDRNKINYRIGP